VLTIHQQAPDFEADAVRAGGAPPERVRLAALRGRWVVLFFYPRDFSSVCPTELRALGKRHAELAALGVELLALSVDELETHRRWLGEVLGPLPFPLVADPGGAVARAWGVLLPAQGVTSRATFVVDPAGLVRHASATDPEVGRSVSELLRVVEALQAGHATPAEAGPGEPVA
jgi:alkyl hydroperoxide reductase subunit AhpC